MKKCPPRLPMLKDPLTEKWGGVEIFEAECTDDGSVWRSRHHLSMSCFCFVEGARITPIFEG